MNNNYDDGMNQSNPMNQSMNGMNQGNPMNQSMNGMNQGNPMNQPMNEMNQGNPMNQPMNGMNQGNPMNQPMNGMNQGNPMNQPMNGINQGNPMNQPMNGMNQNNMMHHDTKNNNSNIIIIVIIVLGVIAAICLGILIFSKFKVNKDNNTNDNNKPVNVYEDSNNNNDNKNTNVNTNDDTFEYNSIVFKKISGYNYSIDSSGLLIVKNNKHHLNFNLLGNNINNIIQQKDGYIESMVNSMPGLICGNGYSTSIDGINVMYSECEYQNVKEYAIFLPLLNTNYSFICWALSKDNTYDISLLNIATSIVKDSKPNSSSFSVNLDGKLDYSGVIDSIVE